MLLDASKWLGGNKLISHEHFGWKAYYTSPSIFFESSGRDVSNLRSLNFSPVLTNLDIPPTSSWYQYLQNVYFDYGTGTANIHIRDETQPLAAPAVDSLLAALDYVASLNEHSGCFRTDGVFNDGIDEQTEDGDLNSRCSVLTSRCWSAIVLFNEPNEEQYTACLQAALAHLHPPLIFYDVYVNSEEYFPPKIVNNSTVVFCFSDSTDLVSHLHIAVGEYDMNKKRSIKNMTFSKTNLHNLPLELMDAKYIEDQKYLRKWQIKRLRTIPL